MHTKRDSKISHRKKHKPKLKSHIKTTGSSFSKRKDNESLNKRTRNGPTNRKLIGRKILHKSPDTESSKKLSSLRLQSEKLAHGSCEGNGETADGDIEIKKLRRRRKRKRRKLNVELDEASRLQRRTRYLLIKMKQEQSLIDAYSGEGWKGQSREKIKPEKELQRANKQILKCKLGIRDVIRQLDLLSSVGSIEDSVIAPDGSVYHEHIFCAKCKLRDAFPDNDIILCDGTCNSAFHQKCLDPPLDTENIPPGDQGWFCRFCDCKMEMLEAVNAHLGTHFSMNSNWQDVFKEEAAFPDGANSLLNPDEEWPSDDSEDDDYNPDRRENSCSISGAATGDDVSDDELSSNSSAASGESTDAEIICSRRQRRDVDYKKLYDEMFGKEALPYEQISEDEDWGPAKKRRREKESDAASTLMTLYESDKKCSDVDVGEVERKLPQETRIRRSFFRIPHNAVERLREVFAENELPSRAVKENLSKELGLDPEKVSKWFKNARYLALKTRKSLQAERQKLHSFTSGNSKDSGCENFNKDSADLVASEDTSTETVIHNPKDVKVSCQRKHRRTLSSPVKKRQPKESSVRLPANNSKETLEFSDDVSLKKLLKARTKEKKKVNFITVGECRAAEEEMERLCKIKDRLENLKQKLLEFKNDKAKNSVKPSLNGRSVIYVPVAELREKA
ncbi:pathogenesis-related homeodomain protein isoform X1 [Ziziphus jujuba]|uniref:Pathogenesis-related homeodomain protein isoform X1 n=1 Tax=Ziziphus jujuba TaxID=326968 RepID=A0ABM4ADU0_ZIZJJ|nr:pathogenesis-related homeodomain protein isoform X1 [Ziziphus jujuba]